MKLLANYINESNIHDLVADHKHPLSLILVMLRHQSALSIFWRSCYHYLRSIMRFGNKRLRGLNDIAPASWLGLCFYYHYDSYSCSTLSIIDPIELNNDCTSLCDAPIRVSNSNCLMPLHTSFSELFKISSSSKETLT